MDWMTIIAIVCASLLGLSEGLSMIPSVKANGIYQAIVSALRFAKEKLLPKP